MTFFCQLLLCKCVELVLLFLMFRIVLEMRTALCSRDSASSILFNFFRQSDRIL